MINKNKIFILIGLLIIILIGLFIFNYTPIYIEKKLKITHNAGFFSCCNIKLFEIIQSFNKNKILPGIVDSSEQFNLYKPSNLTNDITEHFFTHQLCDIIYKKNINILNSYNNEDQFSNYKLLNLIELQPFIYKYFYPSNEIINIQNNLLNKYNINTTNCIALYYRGTDKQSETLLGDFDKYNEMLQYVNNNNYTILIQTDSSHFLNYIKQRNNNYIIINENKVSENNTGIHNENDNNTNYNDIKYLFATFLILSKCKHIIMSSGNCSLWTIYYRGNADNIYQYLNDKFI